MKLHTVTSAALLLLALIGPAMADGEAKPMRRWGGAVAIEAGTGGDSLEPISGTDDPAGEGLGVMGGAFYRPRADVPLEIYGLVGYRWGVPIPVISGLATDVSSPVVELLANYRFDNKWHVAAGLVTHVHPELTSGLFDFYGQDVRFDTATGMTVEAGWSFIGAYYTSMRYSSAAGNFDASSYGVRFTIRLRKWRPVH